MLSLVKIRSNLRDVGCLVDKKIHFDKRQGDIQPINQALINQRHLMSIDGSQFSPQLRTRSMIMLSHWIQIFYQGFSRQMLLCVQWCPFVFQDIAIPILWTMTSWKEWILKSEPCLLLVGFFGDLGNDSSTGTGGDIQEKKNCMW
jgi:hypothetical protein